MTDITATYSPEDNKLRLYPVYRLDEDTYQRVKAAGFKWAPRQELFVAPSWSPQREDLCIELAGEIEPEGTTIAERAEMKAARLDGLAAKRGEQSNAYVAAARAIGARFEAGQPILVGHHSERRARKDQERMHAAMDKAVAASKAVDYWQWRAAGVEAHANRKANPAVRSRRIKTLLAELRDCQRKLNHAWLALELWRGIERQQDKDDFREMVTHFAGQRLKTGALAPHRAEGSLWASLKAGEVEPGDAVAQCIAFHEGTIANPMLARWIQHILNRLGYERSELGGVPRYEGELTPGVLQTFAREQGADTPKATKQADGYALKALVPLPLHLGEGRELVMTDDQWRDLMQACGHEPADKRSRPAAPPLLNFRASTIKGSRFGRVQEYGQIEMTKAEYRDLYSDYKATVVAECGAFRFRVVMRRSSLCAVFLTDSKAHPVPDSEAVTPVAAAGEQGAA